MKKSNIYIKAFTLVEMLIVIVIIGILIAALLPRMQSAQGRARDVARKSDLSQIGNGIIAYQTDKGERPGVKPNTTHTGMAVADIEDKLITAGMSSVPRDPNGSNIVSGLSDFTATSGNYAYLVARKSGVNNGGFVLMTRTETEAASNRLFKEGEKKLID
jgi:prepilin-type N-terminal cleavage/methylation domain-containing protein